jgi:hypothetical protein
MNESPIIPKTMPELPVPDPAAFFRYYENQLFLKGQRPSPILEAHHKGGISSLFMLLLLLSAAGVIWGILIAVNIPFSLREAIIGSVMSFSSLIGGGFILQHALTRPIKPRHGRIIEGRVIEAEKIRIEKNNSFSETIGIRYEFITPEGKRIQHRAEALNETMGNKMAPAPGTPVYVWYESNGGHSLL